MTPSPPAIAESLGPGQPFTPGVTSWAGTLLAQSGAAATARSMAGVLFWCGVLVALAVGIGFAFYLIRKRLLADEESEGSALGMGFTLSDLRQLHAGGELTDDEFEYAKRKLVASLRGETLDPAPGSDGDDDADREAVDDLGDITLLDETQGGGPPQADKNPGDAEEDRPRDPRD